MIGDTHISDGEEFEVVWDGGEGLIPERTTKPGLFWTPPRRLYNKRQKPLDKPSELEQTPVPSPELEPEND